LTVRPGRHLPARDYVWVRRLRYHIQFLQELRRSHVILPGAHTTDPRTHLLLLEHGGVPVSTCVLHILSNLTRGARPYGLTENVVTRREFRNRGCGAVLLASVLNHAWKQGCYKVGLLPGRRDPAIFRLYEKAGFARGTKEGLIAHPPG